MYDKELLKDLRQATAEWQKKIDPLLKKRPERKERFETISEAEVKRLYTPEDVAGLDHGRDLGLPGEYPYTRGVQPTMYRGRFWTMRQYAGFASARESNRRYRYLLDQGGKGERYQGIVELKGETLADSMQHYFRQSDQVNAGLKLASARFEDGWRAAALLVQQLPEEEGGTLDSPGNAVEDDWRRALILMSSCTDEELLDAELPPRDLLYRLFHEEGVRVFEPQDYLDGCRCSRERIETTLRSMPRDEVESLKVDNALIVTC